MLFLKVNFRIEDQEAIQHLKFSNFAECRTNTNGTCLWGERLQKHKGSVSPCCIRKAERTLLANKTR